MFDRSFRLGNFKLKPLHRVRARAGVLALILVVPFLLDRVRVLENSRIAQIQTEASELFKLAKHSADAQREMISSVEAVLRSAAYVHQTAELTGGGCPMMRDSFYVELPWINGLSIAGADGKIKCSTTSSYIGLNVGDRDYYKKAIETRHFILGDSIINRITHQPAVIAAYASPAALPADAAVMMANINMQWLAQRMSDLESRPGAVSLLVDGKGAILAAKPSGVSLTGQRVSDKSLLDLMAARDSGSTFSIGADGIRRAVSFARVTGTDARMVVSVEEATIFAAIDSETRWAYAQFALISLLVLGAILFLAERFAVKPIRALSDAVARFGAGDMSVRSLPRFLPPVLEPLAKAFNVMAAQLAERERELRAANNQLAVLASIDTVSGLANRRGFDSRLDFEWMKSEQVREPLAFMMIDIDFFKLFNDNYGHVEGDNCLRKVSETIADIANRVNGFAARYGGEEFSLLLPGAEADRAVEVAGLIRSGIEALGIPHRGCPTGHLTVSVGVASADPHLGGHPRDLVEAADAGLYAAKRRGRNTVVEHGAIRAVDHTIALVG